MPFSDASFVGKCCVRWQRDGASLTLDEGQLDTLAIAMKAYGRSLEDFVNGSDALRIERRECEEILAMLGETLEEE